MANGEITTGGTQQGTTQQASTYEWFLKSINDEIKEFENLMRTRRQTLFWLKIAAAFLGATATVLVGLQNHRHLENAHPYLAMAALVATASVTFLTAWGTITNRIASP